MSFFESEYFPTSSNDEVGNGGGESSTYLMTDTLLDADNVLGSSDSDGGHGDLDEGDLLGMANSTDGQGSYDISSYDIDQPSLMKQLQSAVGSVPSSPSGAGTTYVNDAVTSNGIQQQAPVISFSRATFKSSYLGASAHLGRSSAIASMMGVSGMTPTTPRIGGVRAFQEAGEEDDEREMDGEENGRSRKSQKAKKDKREKNDQVKVAEEKTKEKKKRKERNGMQVSNDDENVHPVLSNITRLDLEECVDNLCTEESVQWNMKTWAIEVGSRLGIDIKSRPDIKNTLRDIVLERAMVSIFY